MIEPDIRFWDLKSDFRAPILHTSNLQDENKQNGNISYERKEFMWLQNLQK